tara:strand:- start:2041 stop:2223 length:183 start_codon:yes stop_codon:yes gene_type:complete
MKNTQIEKANEDIKKAFDSIQRLKKIILMVQNDDKICMNKYEKLSEMQSDLLDMSLNLRK